MNERRARLVIVIRRGRAPGSGKVNSRICIVFGSMLATRLPPNSTTKGMPLEFTAIP